MLRKIARTVVAHRAARAVERNYTQAESRGVPSNIERALAAASVGVRECVRLVLSDPNSWQFGGENIAQPGEAYREAVTDYRPFTRAVVRLAGQGEQLSEFPAGTLQTLAVLGDMLLGQQAELATQQSLASA